MQTHDPADILSKLQDAVDEFQARLKSINGQTVPGNNTVSPAELPPETQDDPATRDMEVASTPESSRRWQDSRPLNNYKSACNTMKSVLQCFASHFEFVKGNSRIIAAAKALRDICLESCHHLEEVFNVAIDAQKKKQALIDAKESLTSISYEVYDLKARVGEGAAPNQTLHRWESCLDDGILKINYFIDDNRLEECLGFIHSKLLSDLETMMVAAAGELVDIREKSMSDWFATQKADELGKRIEDYLSFVFPDIDVTEMPTNFPAEETVDGWRGEMTEHRKAWDKMSDEMGHVISHYVVVGGDKEVVNAAKQVQGHLKSTIKSIEGVLDSFSRIEYTLKDVKDQLRQLTIEVITFQNSLYHQKHAFYFREVKQWVTCLRNGLYRVSSYLYRGEYDKCLVYFFNNLVWDVEHAMLGIAKDVRFAKTCTEAAATHSGNVAQELTTFRDRSLPEFLANEMERDTTRFVNITTIATFFSSVTATTLQFTYNVSDNGSSESLRGIVNLFWFLSLAFSVSSGISSLMGLTWRKSSIYDSRKPPMLIHMWFDKAPMVCLIIAAVAFVIGLNLFAYLSLQPRYVSLTTNIFTGMHAMCLLIVTAWFIYSLKYDSFWAKWIRIVAASVARWAGLVAAPAIKWARLAAHATGKWINAIVERIKTIWQKSKPHRLHLLRNIFWALEVHGRVACLNMSLARIDWERIWPGPYLLSRCIRRIVRAFKCCCRGIKALFTPSLVHRCDPGVQGGRVEEDIEIGTQFRETVELSEQGADERAEGDYRESLRETFGEAELVDEIMLDIEKWKRGRWSDVSFDKYIRIELWGYPELLRKFNDEVRPILARARDNVSTMGREERPERRTPEANTTDPTPGPSRTRDEDAVEDRSTSSPRVAAALQEEDGIQEYRSGAPHSQQPDARVEEPTEVDEQQASSDVEDSYSMASENTETDESRPNTHIGISSMGGNASDSYPRPIVENEEKVTDEEGD